MGPTARMFRYAACLMAACACTATMACSVVNVLKVPLPVGVTGDAGVANQAGAEAGYAGGKSGLFQALVGGGELLQWTELLTDEFTWAAYGARYQAEESNIDARQTAGFGGFDERPDLFWQSVLQARVALVGVLPNLRKYEPASSQSKVGDTYALIGYAELIVAESFCDGTPLSEIPPGGGLVYGEPLADSALARVAEMDFDSAAAYAAGNDTVLNVAAVGLGRALLDRGLYDSAAAAVATVPIGFVYNAETEPSNPYGEYTNIYIANTAYNYSAEFNISDREGVNGLNFLTANDARLTFDTTYQTVGHTTWYLPTKFTVNPAYIPLASGLEAALIQAEATLQRHDTATWLADLNALRTSGAFTVSGPDTTWGLGTGAVPGQTAGLRPLVDPGSDTARVSLMFRERAFWLFGTGSRLGDLRRLVRQYGRDQSVVFPTGTYLNGTNPNLPSALPNYGADVNLTLPTSANQYFNVSNPHYRGCTTSTKTA